MCSCLFELYFKKGNKKTWQLNEIFECSHKTLNSISAMHLFVKLLEFAKMKSYSTRNAFSFRVTTG